jgi:hypothetical protein
MLADAVTIEQRRKYLLRDRRGNEQRIGHERLYDRLAQLPSDVAAWRQLLVLLDHRRLPAGSGAPVFPIGGVHRRAKLSNLRLVQYIRHTDQHRVCLHIERCGRQLLFRTLELELLLEASREHHTEHTP